MVVDAPFAGAGDACAVLAGLCAPKSVDEPRLRTKPRPTLGQRLVATRALQCGCLQRDARSERFPESGGVQHTRSVDSKPGTFKGKHYSAHADEVRQLVAGRRLDQAIELLERLVDATEAESRAEHLGVAPWYYEQLAFISTLR